MEYLNYMQSQVVYESRLSEQSISLIAGALLNRLYLDQPVPADKLASVTYTKSVPLYLAPDKPIIKMTKRKYVESFRQEGTIRLGTFHEYSKYDHEEIGDNTEGSFLLVGQNDSMTTFFQGGGGFNSYIFCCFTGDPDQNCIERFGYDSYYKIVNPLGFAQALCRGLQAYNYCFSQCVYSNSREKVIVGEASEFYNPRQISNQTMLLVNLSKYFVKPNQYAHQSEYRFIFLMKSVVDEPIIIKCPDAVKFCDFGDS